MTDALLACLKEHSPHPLAPDAAAWQAALADVRARAAGRWPELAVPEADFVRCLAERLPAGEPAALALLCAEDLYLCRACLLGLPGALPAFEQAYLSRVPGYVTHLDRSPAFADEVLQHLRERLFIAPPGGRARLCDYSGRGALARWLRVAALRTGLSLLRQHGRREAREEAWGELGAAALPEEQLPADLAHLRARYADSFLACLREAVAGLDGEQRALLRLYFISEKSTEKIAAVYRVNRSTVVRWLAAIREEILDETRRRLCASAGISPAEFGSLARDLQGALEVSLQSLLRTL